MAASAAQTSATSASSRPARTASPRSANYLLKPGDSEFHALAIDVLRMQDGAIADMIAFTASAFPAFGLPNTLPV